MNMKSLLIVALLVVGAFAVAIPAPAMASTGHSDIVGSSSQTTPFTSANTPAAFNVTATWGSATLSMIDNVTAGANSNLVIDLSGVTFSGAQFSLWISPNGFSQLNSSTDFQFAGTFNVTSLSASPALHIGSYYIGTDAGHPFVSGPMASGVEVPGGIYYIKVFDGLTTSVAVSSQFVILMPAITIKPTFGPAGADVTVTGHAFGGNSIVNLSIQAPAGTWKGTANTTAGANGYFQVSLASLGVRVPDLQNGAASLVPSWINGTIEVDATDYSTGYSAAPQFFSEAYREFYVLQTITPSGSFVSPANPGPYTNLTDAAGNPGGNPAIINGWVLQSLYVSGLFFNPTTPTPRFTWDGNAITPTHLTPINATGYFDANFTIPITGLGPHFLWVFDATNNMTVQVDVQTTLIIDPLRGPQGTTVTVTGYGFNTGANMTAFWWGTELTMPTVDQGVDYLPLYSQLNLSAGSFTFNFTVPNGVYGGSHDIYVNDSSGTDAAAAFFVTPTWRLDATSGALGTQFHVLGACLPVGSATYETTTIPFSDFNGDVTGADAYLYQLTYDNVLSYQGGLGILQGDEMGVANWTMVSAGVPMTHYVGVVRTAFSSYIIDASLAFLVTGNTTGDTQILSAIAGQSSSLTGIQSSLSSLATSVSGLTTTVNAIQTSLTSLASSQASSFTALNTAVAGVNTAVAGLQSSVSSQFTTVNTAISGLSTSISSQFTSLNSAVTGAQSALGGKIDAVNTAVSGVASSVSTLSGNVGTLSGKVDTVQNTLGTVNTATNNIGTLTTLLYVAVALVIVAVILEVLVLIRKK